jgi:hypothetical protein
LADQQRGSWTLSGGRASPINKVGKYNLPLVDERALLDAILASGRTDPGEWMSVKRWVGYRAKLPGMKPRCPRIGS